MDVDSVIETVGGKPVEELADRKPVERYPNPVPQPGKLADRSNAGKPQLGYLLTFTLGWLSFAGTVWEDWVRDFAEWYRTDFESPDEALDILAPIVDRGLHLCGPDWPLRLAEVSMFGASKYARGNYLRGMKWSVAVDSLMRHVWLMCQGESRDGGDHLEMDEARRAGFSGIAHGGHIAWNLQMLAHCVAQFPELDDRLRPPAAT